MLRIILATNEQGLLAVQEYGQWNTPWPYLPEDSRRLREELARPQCTVIVGRVTWECMSSRLRALPTRVYLLGQTTSTDPRVQVCGSWEEALADLGENTPLTVLGGVGVYAAALRSPLPKVILWTVVHHPYPQWDDVEQLAVWGPASAVEGLELTDALRHRLPVYEIVYEELTYQASGPVPITPHYQAPQSVPLPPRQDPWTTLVGRLLSEGEPIDGRNGTTYSLLGPQLRYDLSEGWPIVVAKRGYPKAIFSETIWMWRGQTDAASLRRMGVRIWDANSSRQTLDRLGLPWEEGDIGPGYGFQLRHYGATYRGCGADYTGEGVDQLADVCRQLREDPTSRRILINLWNPSVIDQCALPPCHVIYQFRVRPFAEPDAEGRRGYLDCHLFQRSWDVFLGWNTTTAALWVYLLAASTDLLPGVLVHSITDAHLYQTHLEEARQTVARRARPLPRLTVTTPRPDPSQYRWTDLRLEDYYPLPAVTAEMVV